MAAMKRLTLCLATLLIPFACAATTPAELLAGYARDAGAAPQAARGQQFFDALHGRVASIPFLVLVERFHDSEVLHDFLEMHHATEDILPATSEQICLHVDMGARRSAPFPDGIRARVAAIREAQADLPVPPQVGSVIGIRRRG